jgi:hypothetical protein
VYHDEMYRFGRTSCIFERCLERESNRVTVFFLTKKYFQNASLNLQISSGADDTSFPTFETTIHGLVPNEAYQNLPPQITTNTTLGVVPSGGLSIKGSGSGQLQSTSNIDVTPSRRSSGSSSGRDEYKKLKKGVKQGFTKLSEIFKSIKFGKT